MSINNEQSLSEWFSKELEEAHKDPEAVAYGIMLRVVGDIAIQMDTLKLKQSELAKRLKVSEGWVSRLLNAPPNMSVLKIVEAAMELGMEVDVRLTPRAVKSQESISQNYNAKPEVYDMSNYVLSATNLKSDVSFAEIERSKTGT